MDLIREIEALRESAKAPLDQEQQLDLVDSLEKTLAAIGVTLQPKFEISLTSRVLYPPVSQPT
jgi:hypothetical protein